MRTVLKAVGAMCSSRPSVDCSQGLLWPQTSTFSPLPPATLHTPIVKRIGKIEKRLEVCLRRTTTSPLELENSVIFALLLDRPTVAFPYLKLDLSIIFASIFSSCYLVAFDLCLNASLCAIICNNTDIKISSARDLRNQLREIVPQNSEGSKIFCPNGPSAAVSPMMENKCGDRMATASVFGRTEDTVGNSVPGFNGGKYPGVGGGTSGLAAAETGGFLSYGEAGQTPGRANGRLVSR